MEKEQLSQIISESFPVLDIDSSKDTLRVKTDAANIHGLATFLRHDSRLQFDYLMNMYGIDFESRFAISYHLESTLLKHAIFVEISISDHDNPAADTVSDIWKTAQYQEREIYDLMGIKFNNHPDLRRLFLEDGWGFPLRKDYKDEINIIER